MGSFDDLLSSLGFGAADAANQEGLIARKAALGRSQIDLQADEDRQTLNAGYEGRGVFNSGEALLGNARLEGKIANQKSAVDIAAADDYLGLQRQLQQEQAQKEASDRAFNLQVELANREYQTRKQQIEQQAAAQKRYDDAYLGQLGRNY